MELLVAIVVMTILLAIAIPSYLHFKENNVLLGAAQAVYSDIQFARSEAVKRDAASVGVYFSNLNSAWCYRVSDDSACDCSNTNADKCDLHGDGIYRGMSQSDFPNVNLIINTASSGKAAITVDSYRAKMDATSIVVRYGNDTTKEISVQTNALGRVLMCSPSGSVGVTGIDSCP